MRGTIAKRMHASLQQMAQLTIGSEVDVTRAVKLRDRLKRDWADDRRVPTLTDLVIKACALALREHPGLNATVGDDAVELLHDVHVGLAVALDGGLVVPPIRHADELSLAEIAAESARLADAARSGALALDDLTGGTFSVTTLGSLGVDFFTPVINPPNVAILGVGRARDGVGWKGDVPKRRRLMTLSLTFDHRAVDGAPAAAFLAAVGDHLGAPNRLLT
jgi:pyruvate/2-oxoglutarate dehydrogenase complex dihydrolipoamide acyltransferase (E2) component